MPSPSLPQALPAFITTCLESEASIQSSFPPAWTRHSSAPDPMTSRNEVHILMFAGEYLPDYDTAFLEAFAGALTFPEVKRTGIKLLVVGTLELNRTRLISLLDKFELREQVEFLDQKPQRDGTSC